MNLSAIDWEAFQYPLPYLQEAFETDGTVVAIYTDSDGQRNLFILTDVSQYAEALGFNKEDRPVQVTCRHPETYALVSDLVRPTSELCPDDFKSLMRGIAHKPATFHERRLGTVIVRAIVKGDTDNKWSKSLTLFDTWECVPIPKGMELLTVEEFLDQVESYVIEDGYGYLATPEYMVKTLRVSERDVWGGKFLTGTVQEALRYTTHVAWKYVGK